MTAKWAVLAFQCLLPAHTTLSQPHPPATAGLIWPWMHEGPRTSGSPTQANPVLAARLQIDLGQGCVVDSNRWMTLCSPLSPKSDAVAFSQEPAAQIVQYLKKPPPSSVCSTATPPNQTAWARPTVLPAPTKQLRKHEPGLSAIRCCISVVSRSELPLLPVASTTRIPSSRTHRVPCLSARSPTDAAVAILTRHPRLELCRRRLAEGYFDKAPSTPETSSAKALVFQSLKQTNRLQGLSIVYTEVLKHRRALGLVGSLSSFKPPPRVTLTDTKREVWLKDLANPAITLRRLSRTIPHGIRGRVLLDQCLNKKVPIERAVWLAKCVGANEIRAVRRKGTGQGTPALGMGGEAKWNRDWTVCVEQFVEGTITAIRSEDWKWRVDYAMRLARHLSFAELLDKDHYSEWLVSGLENSHLTKLPLWMILTQIHWRDILRLRKYGRRLVGAILNHLSNIQGHADNDLLQPVVGQLRWSVCRLLALGPESFVCPGTWLKHRSLIQESLPPGDASLQVVFKSVDSRNEQLASNCVRSQPAARAVLVRLLDATLHSPIPKDLSIQCLAVTKDRTAVARILLEWCTSLQRPGLAKMYVAVGLLKSWAVVGLDVTDTILQFLSTTSISEAERKDLVFRLVTELARVDLFSTHRYVQWLIARGGLSKPSEVEMDGPCITRLLVELPDSTMNESLRGLRASMLRRASYPVKDQNLELDNAIEAMKHILGMQPGPGHYARRFAGPPMSLHSYTRRLAKTVCSVKLQVAFWLRTTFLEALKQQQLQQQQQHLKGAADLPSDAFFCSCRRILEACQDFTMLGDLLRALSVAPSADVLASCSDTLMLHYPVFNATGVLKPLFETLLARLSPIVAEEHGSGVRRLLASLAALAGRMPGRKDLAARLSRDLNRYDRTSEIDACSPVSDNNHEAELQEEGAIEKLLASGTSIDKPTLERLFEHLVGLLQQLGDKDEERLRYPIGLLVRLRVLDPKQFDYLMARWIRTQSRRPNRLNPLLVYPPMVSLGCLSLSLVLSTLYGEMLSVSAATKTPTQPAPPTIVNSPAGSTVNQEILQLVLRPLAERCHVQMSTDERYRFHTSQKSVIRTNPNELLTLIRMAATEYAASSTADKATLPLANDKLRVALRSALMELVLTDFNTVARYLAAKHGDAGVSRIVERDMEMILVPGIEEDRRLSFDQVLELCNELTLPFCQLKLMASLTAEGAATGTAGAGDPSQRLQSQLELFARAMDKAIDARNITWTGMLSCLNPEITQHLRHRAQARFLDLLPSPGSLSHASDADTADKVQMAESLVSVMDIIIRGGSTGKSPPLASFMIDKLTDMWEILATAARGRGPPDLEADPIEYDDETAAAMAAVCNAIRRHWLPQLLTFLTLHTTTLDPSKASVDVRARAVIVLSGIAIELGNGEAPGYDDTHPMPPPPSSSTEDEEEAAEEEDEELMIPTATTTPTTPTQLSDDLDDQQLLQLQLQPPPQPPQPPQAQQQPPPSQQFKWRPFAPRRWELLNEPTPNIGENDSSLSLSLFRAFKVQ
ncbi:hypothetical protein MAPG_01991 [Magnaporthiopsis poae ATCC 64411]|uniref:Mediator of RNA polymerase II transcription subunit 12 n=1 Tax=Magnaporthiopsis poae (strain ATCC 64411 / 73-15) TaxID=644358 RepID=A0A0C4DQ53_MAGP6|nr:hypothetical protein MAPG_01991 [Magnaporthiopsis poae ATCC 64411]